MRQVSDNVFALGSRGHNFYLVVESGGVTVVDAGCSREWSKLMSGLESVGKGVGDVAGVLITHVHSDHFGLAARAQREKLDVLIHPDDEPRALGTYTGRFSVAPSDIPKTNWWALRSFLPLVFEGVLKLEHVAQVGSFTDGETLDLPGRPIPIHTPGHTEGHAMFHCPDLGLLFTGDGLVTMDLLGSAKGPQVMKPIFHVDDNQMRRSLERVAKLDAGLLLPGHGEPWKGRPDQAVQLALA